MHRRYASNLKGNRIVYTVIGITFPQDIQESHKSVFED